MFVSFGVYNFLYLLACITFTEDKVPTAVVAYSKAHFRFFFCRLLIIIWNNWPIRKPLKLPSWHLWEYFHNQSARCNLNSISSFLTHPQNTNQNFE